MWWRMDRWRLVAGRRRYTARDCRSLLLRVGGAPDLRGAYLVEHRHGGRWHPAGMVCPASRVLLAGPATPAELRQAAAALSWSAAV